MGPETLAQVLRPLKDLFHDKITPELLVGLDTGDDAAVYKITNDKAIIHTVDFFTPIVDDPYDFGAIAAANALSDVYAMGGSVILALNICGFPPDFPIEIIHEILQGGAEKVAESGGILAGGHTVEDKEPKYGLSVMGIVHPDKLFTTKDAKSGEVLVLTKPLGVGIVTTALKSDVADPAHIKMASENMKKLNRKATELFQQAGVHTCTDITGFSLLGHCDEIAKHSGVQLKIEFNKLPFIEGAKKYAEEWLFPGGSCKNETCYKKDISFVKDISKEMQMLLYTPETSGGLLAAIAVERLEELLDNFKKNNEQCWVVGEVKKGKGIEVIN